MSYNYKYKALWYRVPKVASRTINQHFIDHTPTSQYIYSSEVGYFPSMFSQYYKFAFTRQPFDRFISGWKNKVLEMNYYNFPAKEWETMKKLENFIAWVETLDLEKCDEHLRAQYTLIDVDHVDFVGKLENFDMDFKKVADAISLPIHEVYKKNRSNPKSDSVPTELRHRIDLLYKKDNELFY